MATADRFRERLRAPTFPSVTNSEKAADDNSDQIVQVHETSDVGDHSASTPDGELPPSPDSGTVIMTSEDIPSPDESFSPNPAGRSSIKQDSDSPDFISTDLERDQSDDLLLAQNGFPNPVTSSMLPSGRMGANTTQRAGNSSLQQMNPLLRNRLRDSVGAGEEPDFRYPEIHSDPGQRYHDLFGVDEKQDPFIFPELVNLIFEDRWLLAEQDPAKAVRNQLQRRVTVDIRDPDPDLANFPNGAYTIPKGRLYIENSPVGFYGGSSNGQTPRVYQWEYLIRYGLTDNLEFRVFSNGLTDQAAHGHQPNIVGNQPLAFDFKANFWEENTKYHVPAMGVEIYLETNLLGSTAFNGGTQPSINLLFDQSLPLGLSFEYNIGYTGVQNAEKEIAYQFSYQWSLQREIVKDFDVFFHGFYNAAALPRLSQFQSSTTAAIPNVTVAGLGWIWTVNNRVALFGSYNFGITPASPTSFALMGFAVAL